MSPLEMAQPSRLRRLPESNRWKVPQGHVRASAPLTFVRKSYAARRILERAIFERDGSWNCFYCGSPAANSVDHVTARFRGGSDGIDNLVFACWPCNETKNTKPGWLFVLDLFRGTSAPRLEPRQPPEAVDPLQDTPHSKHLDVELLEAAKHAVGKPGACEPEAREAPEGTAAS